LRLDALQQIRNQADARVRHETRQADRAGVYVDPIRLRENGVTCGNVERSDAGTPVHNEEPGLSVCLQAPSGVWRQIYPFEYEVRT
jgi:hypothetical protein